MRTGQDVLPGSAGRGAEWLLSNGLGGSSSGTVAGTCARRTHALLVAASAHGRRFALLLGTDERLRAGGWSVDLAAPAVPGRPGAVCEGFTADPVPTWILRAGDVLLEKTVLLVPGHHAVAIGWRQLEGPDVVLTVSPLVVNRDPDGLQAETPHARGASQLVPGRLRIELPGPGPALTMWHNGAFMPARVWRTVEHADEAGEARHEAAFVPGYVEALMRPGSAFHVVASSEEDLFRALAREDRLGAPPPKTLAECMQALLRDEREQRAAWVRRALRGAAHVARRAARARAGAADAPVAEIACELPAGEDAPVHAGDGWTAPLASTLLAGLARRGHRLTIVASLPGGPERGADALRAVPALIAVGAFEPARAVVGGYLEYLDEGVAPEGFDPSDGTPRYGDPAPSLWLVRAAEHLARRSGDTAYARDVLAPALEGVVQAFRAGTRGGIRVDADGLLAAGEDGAKRADVNALWSRALVAMAQIARLAGRREHAAFYLAWARDHRAAFLERFWDEARGALHERIVDGAPVPGLGPGQLLALTLSPPLLDGERAARLLERVERKLATPFGLRDAPGAGSVRPEWLAHFVTATLRVRGRTPETRLAVRGWFDALRLARGAGVAQALPERYDVLPDGAARPAGDPVSIVAVAEVLRAWVEEVEHDAGAASAAAGPGAAATPVAG
uniref:Glycogen debranching protein n=1 Tax=Eiseniibacteriota bacterium TaxID=2212470 RepID=A0A832MLB9_UNCEI